MVAIFSQRTTGSLFLHEPIVQESRACSANPFYGRGLYCLDACFLGLCLRVELDEFPHEDREIVFAEADPANLRLQLPQGIRIRFTRHSERIHQHADSHDVRDVLRSHRPVVKGLWRLPRTVSQVPCSIKLRGPRPLNPVRAHRISMGAVC